MKSLLVTLSLIAIFSFFNCTQKSNYDLQEIEDKIGGISKGIIPDKRVGIKDITIEEVDKTLKITTKSNFPSLLDSIRNYVNTLPYSVDTIFTLLPNREALDNKIYAVVNISVANLRSLPKHSAELATQSTLGTPLKVFEKKDNWYRVQTPDKYIAWVDLGGIVLLNETEYNAWLGKPKLIVIKPIDKVYESTNTKSQVISDLAGGNILVLQNQNNNFYEIAFPDGRQGFIEKEAAQLYEDWLAALIPSAESLTKVSKQMLGIPYLWGGTSFKGVDCSGFTKTIYFMNGMVIPRDASQQVHAGKPVDTSNGFDNLLPGDLLFFGRKATSENSEKVVHVAMWLGNNEFIHASGRVRINSFDSNASNYNEYELNRFLRAKRMLNVPQELILPLTNAKLFYAPKI